jgi:hypothetical protein
MEEQTVRTRAEAWCDALVAGDMELAGQDLSDQLSANLGELVAMLPMPLTSASVESLERTPSGFLGVVHLVGETSETRLETRWKERDDRPVIVEVSHVTEEAAGSTNTEEPDPEQ